jgi:mannitol-1-/sugar-/sorbitol-6-/2-deoxyglucose-6-phosphatase
MQTRIKAVIYDMDGILIDSEPLWQLAQIETFVELGFKFTHEMCEQTVGWRVDEVISYWTQKFGYTLHSNEFIVGVLLDKLKLKIAENGKAMQGVYESLEFFKSKQLPMAVATSSPITIMQQVIETLNIQKYFKHLCSAQYESHGKPHPAVFLNASTLLQIEPIHCLVLEDSLNGVIAAKSARMKCVAIPEPHNKLNPKFCIADKQLESLHNFNEALWEEINC